ncbi:MAG: hypothetical protein J6R59_10625 [Paludibacteraceae bacterium]|nr:hypothetical protein [Paludibacteraceae bacterium]
MNIIDLYEDLRKYIVNETQYDDLFYNAPEGEAQIDIVKEMLEEIINKI